MKYTTDYAIRIVLYLAIRKGVIPSQEIARCMEVPPHYLLKIVRSLRDAGLVGAEQGSQGGYCLRKPLDHISILNIIDSVEQRDKGPRWDVRSAPVHEAEAYGEVCRHLDGINEYVQRELSLLTIRDILDAREVRQEEEIR